MEERRLLAARLRWRDELRAEAEANQRGRGKRKSEAEAEERRVAKKKKKKKTTRKAQEGRDGQEGGGGEREGGDPGEGAALRGWALLESLDPDTALCVLSFLDTEDLVRQRAVSRRWSDLASADCLWKPRFLRLYGPPFVQGEEEGVEGSWFGRYAEASRGMPRMPPDQDAPFPSELTDWEAQWELDRDQDDDSEFEIKDAQFSVVALPHLRRSEVGLHHHRLALHLAFLHTNGHVPRLTDRVRIGGRLVKHATITLARFCYAVGNQKQSQLLEQLGLPSSPLDNSTYLSPDVGDESDFEPFVRLRIPSPKTAFAPGESPPYSFIDNNPETFGEAEVLGASYQFISDKKKGWAPGFFNASFTWYSYGCFTTLHNTARREIFVIKTRERKGVW